MKPVTLATIRPGPVLHVWQDGQELAAIPLTPSAALLLAADLLRAVAEVRAGMPAITREGMKAVQEYGMDIPERNVSDGR